MNQQESFRQWMKDNAASAGASIDKYCAAINTIRRHLRECTNQDKDIYLITDQEEVSVIRQLYKTNEKMKEKNKGNMYSAALGWYERFLNSYDEQLGTSVSQQKNLYSQMLVNQITNYLINRGYYYSESTIRNFYMSLKSKPFVILSGISGTGKSKLVRLFAEAIDAKFELIPVRPDWSDATELLGYKDINQNFQAGKLTQIMIEASNNPDKPYIVCLDEMNLARVEYYFSDFLSLIESRHWDGKTIVTDQLANESIALNKSLSIPDNLYIIGTVNMDETTLQFSNKVLDRANTIELNEVDLTYNFEDEVEIETEAVIMPLHNIALRSKYLILRDCKAYAALADRVIKQLIDINDILKIAQMQFAYRVRDEVIFYMAYNEEYNFMREKEAFDYQLLQKILPRINGTSARIHKMITKLLEYCIEGKITEHSYNLEDLVKKIPSAYYPKSATKLLDMLRRYDEDGFTSFWS